MFINDVLVKQVTQSDWKFWADIVDVVHLTQYHVKASHKKNLALNVDCHSICWALSILMPGLKRVDGRFFGICLKKPEGSTEESIFEVSCDHSWLLTPDNAIIDPYPVGFVSPNPIIIGNGPRYQPFGRAFYIEDSDVTRKKVLNREVFRKCSMIVRFAKEAEALRSLKVTAAA